MADIGTIGGILWGPDVAVSLLDCVVYVRGVLCITNAYVASSKSWNRSQSDPSTMVKRDGLMAHNNGLTCSSL